MVTIDAFCVVSIDRQRYEQFNKERWPSVWPPPQRVRGFNGARHPRPPQWKQGDGAWGCLVSHLRLLMRSASEGETLLVMEDDAQPRAGADVDKEWAAFAGAVPKDWQQIYLGGQYIAKPDERRKRNRPSFEPYKVNEHVLRMPRVHRTLAYIVKPQAAGQLLESIMSGLWSDPPSWHIDWRMEMRHETMNVYAPAQWLVQQRANVTSSVARGKVIKAPRLEPVNPGVSPTPKPGSIFVIGRKKARWAAALSLIYDLDVLDQEQIGKRAGVFAVQRVPDGGIVVNTERLPKDTADALEEVLEAVGRRPAGGVMDRLVAASKQLEQ